MKLKNDWWGYSDHYGWAVMIEVINEHRNGGDAVFYSFKTNGEFDRPFRDLERHDMTFALRHFKTLPAQQQVLEKAEFEKARTAWPSVQAKRIVDKNHEIELQKQEQVNLKAQKEHEARDAEIERRARYVEAALTEQLRRQSIKLSRANAAIKHLSENGINNLWHFTSMRNLEGIVSSGYLYGRSVNPHLAGVNFLSDQISQEQDSRLGRDHLVRLSFIPNSWYFHRVNGTDRLIWLKFSLDFLKTETVHFAKGNGASANALMSDEISELAIDWATMRRFQGSYTDETGPKNYPRSFLNDGDDQVRFREESNTWNSEIMVENSLPISYFDGVYDARTGAKIQL